LRYVVSFGTRCRNHQHRVKRRSPERDRRPRDRTAPSLRNECFTAGTAGDPRARTRCRRRLWCEERTRSAIDVVGHRRLQCSSDLEHGGDDEQLKFNRVSTVGSMRLPRSTFLQAMPDAVRVLPLQRRRPRVERRPVPQPGDVHVLMRPPADVPVMDNTVVRCCGQDDEPGAPLGLSGLRGGLGSTSFLQVLGQPLVTCSAPCSVRFAKVVRHVLLDGAPSDDRRGDASLRPTTLSSACERDPSS